MGRVKDVLLDALSAFEFKGGALEPEVPQLPLTDDEIRTLWQKHGTIFEFARAIEREHGIGEL
jgi:hypothetical protein